MAHLIHRIKRAKGREYPTWLWRTTRRNPDNWRDVQTFDVELGQRLASLRSRTLVALGDLSAAAVTRDLVRWRFGPWIKAGDLGAFTGWKVHAKPVAWWVTLPTTTAGRVSVTLRSRPGSGYDLRTFRPTVRKLEAEVQEAWQQLTDDPVMRIAELRWQEAEAQAQVDRGGELLTELRRDLKRGDLSRRDFEADERLALLSVDAWEGIVSTLQRRWDERAAQIRDALPRTTREALMARVIARAERLQHDPAQCSRWRSDHWDGDTFSWA